MSDQMNLFALMGLEEPEIEKTPAAKKEAKEPAADKKTSSKPTPVERRYDEKVSLFFGNFAWEHTFDEKPTLKMIEETLISEVPAAEVYELKDNAGTIKIALSGSNKQSDSEMHDTIYAGITKIKLPEPCNAKDALSALVSEHPEYAGCKVIHSKKTDAFIALPEPLIPNVTAECSLPAVIGWGEHVVTVSEGKADKKLFQEAYKKAYPDLVVSNLSYNEETSRWLPVLGHHAKTGTTQPKKEERYKFPITVRTSLTMFEYTAEDFPGKEDVTMEDIRKKVEERYPEYSKERTEMVYDAKGKFVVPILKSSRKGGF